MFDETQNHANETYSGSCECGAITYTVKGPLKDVTACHCNECRKSSGHFCTYVKVKKEKIELHQEQTLTWFTTSNIAKKAFCSTCGSNMFWVLDGRQCWSIMAGSFDIDLPVKLSAHIFTAEKANYYTIDDGLPQAERYDIETSTQPSVASQQG